MTLNKTLSSLLIAACATGALASPTFAANRGVVSGPQKSIVKSGANHGKRGTRSTTKSRNSRKAHRGGRTRTKSAPKGGMNV